MEPRLITAIGSRRRRSRASSSRRGRRSGSALVQERWHADPDEHRGGAGGGDPRSPPARARARLPAGADAVAATSRSTPTAPTAAGARAEELPGGPTHALRRPDGRRDRRPRARLALRARRRRRRPRLQHRDRRRARRRRSSPARASCTSRSPPATTRTATSGPGPTTRRPIPVVELGDGAASASRPAGTSGSPSSRAPTRSPAPRCIVYPTAIGSEPDHPDFDTEPLWEQVIIGQRHRQRHVHGRRQPHRQRAAADVLRLVASSPTPTAACSCRRRATSRPCSSPTSTSTSAATGWRCSRSCDAPARRLRAAQLRRARQVSASHRPGVGVGASGNARSPVTAQSSAGDPRRPTPAASR